MEYWIIKWCIFTKFLPPWRHFSHLFPHPCDGWQLFLAWATPAFARRRYLSSQPTTRRDLSQLLPRKESRRRSRLLPTRIDAHAAYWRKLLASFHRQSNSVDPTRISCSSIFAEWQDVEPTKSRFRQAQSIHSSYRLQHVRLLRQLKLYAHRCFEPDQKFNIRVQHMATLRVWGRAGLRV